MPTERTEKAGPTSSSPMPLLGGLQPPSDDLSSPQKGGRDRGAISEGRHVPQAQGKGGLSCRSNLPEIDSIIHQWQCPERRAFSRVAEIALVTGF